MAATLWKDYKTVKVEKEDGITWCILNRPEKRNAMNPQLHYDMLEALTELEVDKDTKVLVITGAGPSWCAGTGLARIFSRHGHQSVGAAQGELGIARVALAPALLVSRNRPSRW